MDLAAGPDGPPYHSTENWRANTGIFAPGDVIHYFLGAKNTLNQWTYWHRTLDGQGVGDDGMNIADAMASPCEWSVLPDAGRLPGVQGDVLYVDDADDRGGPAQLYFDVAFQYLVARGRGGSVRCARAVLRGGKLARKPRKGYRGAECIGDPTEIYQ